ncbi:MAG TPA: J domain-containing protein [Candidatus Binatia bacterium]|nr:J domain-containing protein [Candidatus Binatia bacterium]
MAVKFRDYYEVLGLPHTASADDIKRAYRQLARKHHPDLQPAAERARAAERFKEINEAYEVLSDPDKRGKYDALGASWKSGMDFTPSGGERASAGAGGWEDLGDVSDFFASLFGRGTGRTSRGGVRITIPGSDIEAELPVTLEELLHSARRRITLNGSRNLEVEIPRGAREGTVLRLAGQGEPGVNGGPPGDVYLRLRLVPHPRYRVAGDDLEMDLSLWPWQAVLGADVRVETPDGPVTLTVPPGTQAGRRLRLRGRGLPRPDGGRGDLYAVVRIVVPERPSAPEREAYEILKQRATAPADRAAVG